MSPMMSCGRSSTFCATTSKIRLSCQQAGYGPFTEPMQPALVHHDLSLDASQVLVACGVTDARAPARPDGRGVDKRTRSQFRMPQRQSQAACSGYRSRRGGAWHFCPPFKTPLGQISAHLDQRDDETRQQSIHGRAAARMQWPHFHERLISRNRLRSATGGSTCRARRHLISQRCWPSMAQPCNPAPSRYVGSRIWSWPAVIWA